MELSKQNEKYLEQMKWYNSFTLKESPRWFKTFEKRVKYFLFFVAGTAFGLFWSYTQQIK